MLSLLSFLISLSCTISIAIFTGMNHQVLYHYLLMFLKFLQDVTELHPIRSLGFVGSSRKMSKCPLIASPATTQHSLTSLRLLLHAKSHNSSSRLARVEIWRHVSNVLTGDNYVLGRKLNTNCNIAYLIHL